MNELLQKHLYQDLEEAIINKESLTLLSGLSGRRTGKTTTIIELAKKYDLPILVDNGELVKLYKKSYGVEAYNANARPGNLEGFDFDTFLVDDVYTNRLDLIRKLGYKVIGLERSNIAY